MYARRSFAVTVVFLAIIATAAYYLAPRVGPSSASADYGAKLTAAHAMLDAENAILDVRREQAEGSQLVADPNIAAMLGAPSGPITTDAGSLRAKVTSTNPNFASVVVDMLSSAGVRSGDAVAVSYTGSFPALDIATIVAIEALDANPIIVSSVGASTWGANDPEFTILDIESLLMQQGIIHHRSIAASVGGDFRVHPLTDEGKRLAQDAMQRNNVAPLQAQKLQHSIQERLQIYDQQAAGHSIKAFVNVGGGLASTGTNRGFDPGLTIGPARGDVEAEGLMYYMGQRNVPIINLTDVVTMAKTYRLSVNPPSLPPIGEGTIWSDWTSLRIRAGLAAALVLVAAVALRLLVLSPSGQREFDSYFGFVPLRIKSLMGRLRRGRETPAAEPADLGEGSP